MRKDQRRSVTATGLQDDLLILSTESSLFRENRRKPPWNNVFTCQRPSAAEDATSRHVGIKSLINSLMTILVLLGDLLRSSLPAASGSGLLANCAIRLPRFRIQRMPPPGHPGLGAGYGLPAVHADPNHVSPPRTSHQHASRTSASLRSLSRRLVVDFTRPEGWRSVTTQGSSSRRQAPAFSQITQ